LTEAHRLASLDLPQQGIALEPTVPLGECRAEALVQLGE